MFIEILNNSFEKQPSLLPALDGLLQSRAMLSAFAELALCEK